MRNKLYQDNAAVLLTVIVLVMVLSVIVISVMSVSITQVQTSQEIVDSIKAESLAQSEFLKFHQEMTSLDTNSLADIDEVSLDGKRFIFSGISTSTESTPNDTLGLTFNIEY